MNGGLTVPPGRARARVGRAIVVTVFITGHPIDGRSAGDALEGLRRHVPTRCAAGWISRAAGQRPCSRDLGVRTNSSASRRRRPRAGLASPCMFCVWGRTGSSTYPSADGVARFRGPGGRARRARPVRLVPRSDPPDARWNRGAHAGRASPQEDESQRAGYATLVRFFPGPGCDPVNAGYRRVTTEQRRNDAPAARRSAGHTAPGAWTRRRAHAPGAVRRAANPAKAPGDGRARPAHVGQRARTPGPVRMWPAGGDTRRIGLSRAGTGKPNGTLGA
jgi:hypothetical protein